MDGSFGKRSVSAVSAPKKRPITAVKDTAGTRDGMGRLCNRIGCCGRVNDKAKGTNNKPLEKPKPLKPSIRPSSSKQVIGSSSRKCSKSIENSEKKVSSKIESSSSANEPGIQELNTSGTQTRKLKLKNIDNRKEGEGLRDRTREPIIGRKKVLTLGESSSSSKGKKIIGVSDTKSSRNLMSSRTNGVSDAKNSRNLISSRTNGLPSVRTRKTSKLETSKGSNIQQSTNENTNTPQTQASSLNGDRSPSDTSVDNSVVSSGDNNGPRHYNLDGIADVLMALDRFGQTDGLSYEQLLSLEASLFGGLHFFDQHRDMRLDIDNMSYEELLVLEEKMGTVSTALSEEEIAKRIKTSVCEYLQSEHEKTRRSTSAEDNKCSICQEEFVQGDEVGTLGCEHGYHTPCIKQWLGLKNWCPICKASPEPLPSSASSSHA